MEGISPLVLVISAWVILVGFVVVGMVGTLLPAFPGGGLIWIGTVAFALMTWGEWISWPTVLVVTVLNLVGGIGQYFISSYGARKFGASRWGAAGALLGFIIGMIVFPPLGALIGAFLGAVCVELYLKRKTIFGKEELAEGEAGAVTGGEIEADTAGGDETEPVSGDVVKGEVVAGPPAPVEEKRGWGESLKENLRKKDAKKATMAGIGAVVGSVASFVFEFVFGLASVAAIIFGILV